MTNNLDCDFFESIFIERSTRLDSEALTGMREACKPEEEEEEEEDGEYESMTAAQEQEAEKARRQEGTHWKAQACCKDAGNQKRQERRREEAKVRVMFSFERVSTAAQDETRFQASCAEQLNNAQSISVQLLTRSR